MATQIVWEQVALRDREIFVFGPEPDSVLWFVHKIELAQVNSSSGTFQEPEEAEGPLCSRGLRVSPGGGPGKFDSSLITPPSILLGCSASSAPDYGATVFIFELQVKFAGLEVRLCRRLTV